MQTIRWGLVVLAFFGSATQTLPCPFCDAQGISLSQEAIDAQIVLFGSLTNAKRDPSDFSRGTTELAVERIIKTHPLFGNGKSLLIDKYIPPDPDNAIKYLVFCFVYTDPKTGTQKIDPYRGIAMSAKSGVADYLSAALAMRLKKTSMDKQLEYFFKYLDDPETEVANDAYKEFAYADYADYRVMAEKLPAEKVRQLLLNPKTPASRIGLYGSMLGHCGTKDDARLLEGILRDPKRRFTMGLDGMMAGYAMLDREKGFAFINEVMRNDNPQGEKFDFTVQHAALRSLAFFWEYRPDLFDKEKILTTLGLLLQDPEMADLAIDQFRKWKQWQTADQVMPLFSNIKYRKPVMRRALARFALALPPTNVEAVEIVEQLRAERPEWMKDVEELLDLENDSAKSTTPNPKTQSPKQALDEIKDALRPQP